MALPCTSVLSRVVVHARGALVTREVALPGDLAEGVVDVAAPGITRLALPGSVRAAVEQSERAIVAVRSELVVPPGAPEKGPTLARVKTLEAQKQRLADEHRVLSARRALLAEQALSPALRRHDGKRPRDVLDLRFREILRAVALFKEKMGALDGRLVALEHEQRLVERELQAARIDDRQAPAGERLGRPTHTVVVRLAGGGPPGKLLVTYAVEAARWWPAYTLHVEEAGRGGAAPSARWTFEAIVAQLTGEDWTGVALALSSADLVFDARLPELASLRFGRAQVSRRRPPRPPPSGVEDMFAGYAAFGGGAFAPAPPPPAGGDDAADEDEDADTRITELLSETAPPPPPRPPPMAPMAMAPMAMAPMARSAGAPAMAAHPPPQDLGAMRGGAPPAQEMAKNQAFGGRRARMESRGAPPGGWQEVERFSAEGGGPDFDAYVAEPIEEPDVVASEVWSDHDRLVLAGADDHARRGRLVPDRAGAADASRAAERAMRKVDAAADARYRDPAESRGMFDHRYEAGGRADVPSDGRVHRVAVSAAPALVTLAWRTVPSESADVYREARVANPFSTALLGGPADVYLDGSLLATTAIDRIDRGGTITCGMGVDDRLKVARNVRVSEESAGLLGGSLSVAHDVEIELASTLREAVKVTVLERVPVTDDKAVEIKLLRANPRPDAYDQSDRGAPIRGGQRFDVTVPAGGKAKVDLGYRLVFSSKLDIVGGSRRG